MTDIKYTLWRNPLRPAYLEREGDEGRGTRVEADAHESGPLNPRPSSLVSFPEGLREVGHAGPGFCYDNEQPRHRTFLHDYSLARDPVTNGEWLAFMADGGYSRPEFWLDAGWHTVRAERWQAPLYWERSGGDRRQFTLSGMKPLDEGEPVCHVSLYEADAFARWSGARLPTEFEWEVAAAECGESDTDANLADDRTFHPSPVAGDGTLRGLTGGTWEWTACQYRPYPGYAPPAGALGEYNGKFMSDQWVLRGGSCATSRSHVRPTYRNFFGADKRWQFSGLRLAR